MRSAQITRYGNTSEVIEIRRTSTPNLSAGKVLVEVKGAGINPLFLTPPKGTLGSEIYIVIVRVN